MSSNRLKGRNFKRPATVHSVPATDDPRSGHECEDRDIMNNRTKSEAGARRFAPARRPPPAPSGNEDVSCSMSKPRRTSEPYMNWLGLSLRQSYEETLNEPVPDSFSALLDRLEQEDESKPSR